MSSISRPTPRTDLVLLVSLYAAEFSLVLIALALHKLGSRPFAVWPPSGASVALLAGTAVLVAALLLVGRSYVRHSRLKSRAFGFTVAMNFMTLVLVVIPLEAGLRWLSRDTPDTSVFGDTVLLPRSWQNAAEHYERVAQKSSGDLSYIVYDPALGWTVGPSRKSEDGMHFSSAEGLRSAQPGAVLAAPKGKRRVAVVGDSMTFAQGVKYEDSWAHQLETLFGSEFEVLNFGVPGYGVDQSYLKFKTAVLAWEPDAVVLAFPEHNFFRTMTVYPFINWPDWDWPFSKPRLLVERGQLRSVNVPAVAPHQIFAAQSVSQLPFVEYDAGYNRSDWERNAFDVLFLKRWLFARFPRWSEEPGYGAADERLRLNHAILSQFIRTAEENRIVPLLVFFPIAPEITRRIKGEETSAERALKALAVTVTDTSPCLIKAGDIHDVYLPDDPHYSPKGNAVVARCVHEALTPLLKKSERRLPGG